jgi:hypothetical protein
MLTVLEAVKAARAASLTTAGATRSCSMRLSASPFEFNLRRRRQPLFPRARTGLVMNCRRGPDDPAKSVATGVQQRSKPDSEAGGRGDVLLRLEAVGEAAIDVRNHHARVKIDPFDRAIVNQKGDGVFRARASVAVDA